jgi:hypothetical protein
MADFNGLWGAMKQYVNDAMPDGVLNNEIPTYGSLREKADYASNVMTDLPGEEDGPADAHRHGLAAALIAQQHGPWVANLAGDTREILSPHNYTPYGFPAGRMDMNNHGAGAAVGAANPFMSREELSQKLYKDASMAKPLGTNAPGTLAVLPRTRWK